MFLAFGNLRSDAGLGVEARYPCAAGAHALRQGALRAEFDFEFAGKELAFEFLVLADIG